MEQYLSNKDKHCSVSEFSESVADADLSLLAVEKCIEVALQYSGRKSLPLAVEHHDRRILELVEELSCVGWLVGSLSDHSLDLFLDLPEWARLCHGVSSNVVVLQ